MKITVDVTEASRLVLREAVADGHCEGYEFGFCSTVPDHSLYITLDGKAYIVKASDVIHAVVAAHIEAKADRARRVRRVREVIW